MSEKSEFQIAFDEFQKDITSTLFELASCSDFFKESSTFPLPGSPPVNESEGKTKTRKAKKPSNEDENNKEEKKIHKDENENETKDEKEWTNEEIDKEIITSSTRTKFDLRSGKFMKNLKKRIKNVDNNAIKERIEILLNEGKIINNVST